MDAINSMENKNQFMLIGANFLISEVKTARNLRIGASTSELLKTYPDAKKDSYEMAVGFSFQPSPEISYFFSMDKDKVTQIYVSTLIK